MSSKVEKESAIQHVEEDWELDYSKTGVVIGLEIHSQLNQLKTKLFCSCDANYRDAPPNTHVCPVCLGLPGTLPVANERAVEFTTRLAIALHGNIHDNQLFFRKNYYYPDMSRNFQITQYNRGGGVPFASGGYVLIKMEDGSEKKVRIDRMHLEDDPGKLTHQGSLEKSPYTLVDYNRCGTALIELVTKPEMYTAKEAREFCKKYKTILTYTGICDVTMEGSFRVDANISLEGHNRVEIKNIGSVKEVEKAIEWEIARQREMIKRGVEIKRETRAWDGNKTILLRTKEQEDDYRYSPEPDLVPFTVSKEFIEEVKSKLPELPDERVSRYVKEFGLNEYDAEVLVSNKEAADFFENCVKLTQSYKTLINWINNDIQGYLNDHNLSFADIKLTPENLAELINMLEDNTISIKIAKQILPDVIKGKNPREIVKKKGLEQISDVSALEGIVDKVIKENPDLVEAVRKKPKAINALFGKVMKETKGKADIGLVRKLLQEKLGQK